MLIPGVNMIGILKYYRDFYSTNSSVQHRFTPEMIITSSRYAEFKFQKGACLIISIHP